MSIQRSPFAGVESPVDLTITELVFRGLRDRPDETVLTCGLTGERLTAAQTIETVQRLAGGFLARGLGPGHVIALMAPNMPHYATVFHGSAWSGSTLTTINPTYTPDELRHQLNDSGAELLVTIPAFLATAQAGAAGTRVREIVVIGEAEGATPLTAVMGDPLTSEIAVDTARHVVVLPYSSGTTGLPKGVMLSHRNLVANVLQCSGPISIERGETTLAVLPFFHIYAMQVLMNLYLAKGASIVTLPRFDLEAALRLIAEHRVRRFIVVPPVVLALAKHPLVAQHDLSSITHVMSAAAPLGAELQQACAARLGCEVVQGYGMTELSPVSHVVPDGTSRPGAVGVCVADTECRITSPETGQPVPQGTEGEVTVRGPQVMLGYLNNPEATARTIDADGWLHTGDLGYIDEAGFLHIVDRVKELIKVKGFQVAPAELEALIVTRPGVADVAVVGAPDDEAGEVPVAFVVRSPGGEVTEDEIKAFVAEHLARYKHLGRVVFVEAIPKSPSGKILRRVLRGQL
jgi:4-coumarate--CoA ligase